MSDSELFEIISNVDKDGDGAINFEDFYKYDNT